LLANGKVLVTGGINATTSAELYDPAKGTWAVTANLLLGRRNHTAALLPNGKVLIVGDSSSTRSTELYDVGLDFDDAWRPEIARARWSNSLRLTGSLFQGISQASSGNTQDSSSNYPVVQLRSIDNSQVAFLPVDPLTGWSDTSFISRPVSNVPPGPALVTVFTNGIPSASTYLVVTQRQR
jgi:large repetitive protein